MNKYSPIAHIEESQLKELDNLIHTAINDYLISHGLYTPELHDNPFAFIEAHNEILNHAKS